MHSGAERRNEGEITASGFKTDRIKIPDLECVDSSTPCLRRELIPDDESENEFSHSEI